ncbi:MAG: hypothetical protein IT424_12675 [Pirellulales bacterium]|nr:hypothetical protein [Pirellulales bacterium]
MEEAKPRPGKPGDRAQIAAEKLRALRERANLALEEHRSRLAQIETELNLRVRQLAEEFEATSARLQQQSSEGRDGEIASLHAQLEEGRQKHEKFVEQLALARRQLDAIQSQPCTACQEAANQLADAQSEIRQLRDELDAAERQRDEDRQRHEKFSEQVAAARAAIAELQARSGDQSAQLLADLEALRREKAAADERLDALARDLESVRAQRRSAEERIDELNAEHVASLEAARRDAELEIAARQGRCAELEADLAARSEAAGDLERQCDQYRQTLASLHDQLARLQAASDAAADAAARRQTESDAARSELETRLAALNGELASARAELAQADAEAASQAGSLSDQLLAAQAASAELSQRLAALETERVEHETQSAQQRAAAEANQAKLTDRIAALEAQQATLSQELTAALADCRRFEQAAQDAQQQLAASGATDAAMAELQQQLALAQSRGDESDRAAQQSQLTIDSLQAQLQQLRESTCPAAELAALQQKFDLALADVQQLKRDNDQLREELSARPAADDGQSPELVALRVERGDLAARVRSLETALEAAQAAASQGDADDLQRRFEMAVDDVRQLKQQNGELREQLSQARSPSSAAAPHSGPLDWAAQKARLMALLEAEDDGGPVSADRKKERARIEDAIAATDRALADKDRELADLRAQQPRRHAADVPDPAEQAEQILSAEPLIAAERERLARLQGEWEEKVRAAELELSVERARLAREQATVKGRLFELQKFEPPSAAPDGEARPRRRWLSALGLGDEPPDDQKPKPK